MITRIETTKELIESKGGLLLIGQIAKKIGLPIIKSAENKNAGNVLTSLFASMAEGNCDFESMGNKRGSLFFKEALGILFVYAKETIRLYLEQLANDAYGIIEQLRESAARIIKMSKLHGVWIEGRCYIPVDIDTSVMDNSKTKKEGVSWTYRGCDGYHPIFAYIGTEGYMANCELRPGSQHCQKGTVGFIRGLKRQLEKIRPNGRFLFRLDSGNDAWETLKIINDGESRNYCIIKHNMRTESVEKWHETAKRRGKLIKTRKGKKVWIGKAGIHPCKNGETLNDVYCVYEVTERKSDSEGNRLLIPDIEVNCWWTNLNCEAEKVIELYHNHATSEQFHSELKNDLDVERLPSGKFDVNRIVLAVAMNAYNALRYLGQQSIEKEVNGRKRKRKRLGKVIRDIICVAGKLVNHAGNLVFKIYEGEPMLPIFLRLNAVLNC